MLVEVILILLKVCLILKHDGEFFSVSQELSSILSEKLITHQQFFMTFQYGSTLEVRFTLFISGI